MAEARTGFLSRMRGRASSFGFSHGIHPPEHKELTSKLPIRRMPYPDELVLPLRQHAGKPAKLVVAKGAHVERGDMLAAADGWVSSPVHASAAGWVEDIIWSPHPDGSTAQAIRLRVERYSAQVSRPRLVPDWHGLSQKQVVQAVQDAGVVGLGGAAFPTHVKLAPPDDVKIDTIVLNGAECEPYLTSDHRVMVEYPERVHFGIRIMMHALGAKRAIVGIERNKPDAIAAMERTKPADLDVTILPLTVKYPQGAEKMLVKAVLGREVPSGRLPAHVGVVVQNVGSAATLAEVFETGLPLVERIVTVSGMGVNRPGNLIVPVGTKLRDLLAFCGGTTADAAEILFGGPMMGLPQRDLDVPVLKGTSGVVVLTEAEIRGVETYPCIHCGRCLDACPMFLNPSHLGDLAKAGRVEEMEAHHLADCMLCGSCSYVCPSNIPLAQLFQASKTALRKRKAVT
ncbi:MAG: electron transport complex subunit RsxC [Gemmatimonadaceae bacterium]